MRLGRTHSFTGDTGGAIGFCLDPHDLAISKYVARREKDIVFNRGMATHGAVGKKQLLTLLELTDIAEMDKKRIRRYIDADFKARAPSRT